MEGRGNVNCEHLRRQALSSPVPVRATGTGFYLGLIVNGKPTM